MNLQRTFHSIVSSNKIHLALKTTGWIPNATVRHSMQEVSDRLNAMGSLLGLPNAKVSSKPITKFTSCFHVRANLLPLGISFQLIS
jgi:hypothetical protein